MNETEQISKELLDVSGDFKEGLELCNSDIPCLFITGKAGTGKSTLLRYFVEKTDKQVIVLAFTGVAALNVGGMTIHSFFKFPPRPITEEDIRKQPNRKIYQKLDTIVIDEISMVRSDLLDGIDLFLRKNGKDPNKPFGGIQMIFFGDLFQLSPIVTNDEELFFVTYYESEWFFDAHVCKNIDLHVHELKTVYRQKDAGFINLLDQVRKKSITHDQLQELNNCYDPLFSPPSKSSWITLTATNKTARRINDRKLASLSVPEYMYEGFISGDFPKKRLPTATELRLKESAQVMFVKNDMERRWVNGTIGKVHSLTEDTIKVELEQEGKKVIYSVGQVKWEIKKYKINYKTQSIDTDVIGTIVQYPLMLAWAVTIHKSQGLTFDKVVIDLGYGAFAHGQTYVALSRCTTFAGIVLSKKLHLSDIIVDDPVTGFSKTITDFERKTIVHSPVPEFSKEHENDKILPVPKLHEEQENDKVLVKEKGNCTLLGIERRKLSLIFVIGLIVLIVIFISYNSKFHVLGSNTNQVIITKTISATDTVEHTFIEVKTVESTKTFTPTKPPVVIGCVQASYLNVRSGPGIEYSIIDYLENEDCIDILNRDNDASWVRYEQGWVLASYLSMTTGYYEALPIATPKSPTVVPSPTK